MQPDQDLALRRRREARMRTLLGSSPFETIFSHDDHAAFNGLLKEAPTAALAKRNLPLFGIAAIFTALLQTRGFESGTAATLGKLRRQLGLRERIDGKPSRSAQ